MTTRERIGALEAQVSSLQERLEFTQGEVRFWRETAENRWRIVERLCPTDDPDMRVLGDSLDRCRKALAAYANVMGLIKEQLAELEKWEDER